MALALKIPRLCSHSPRSKTPLSFSQLFIAYPHPSTPPLRRASGPKQQQNRQGQKEQKAQKKQKARTAYIIHDLSDAVQFSLVDAMRYISSLFQL